MIIKDFFGYTKNGKKVDQYTLENSKGTKVSVLTLGGILQSFVFGGIDIVLGFQHVEDYEKQDAYIGATVGRFANRIGNGIFELNGKTYSLYKNNGPNHLHGGLEGFDRKIWQGYEDGNFLHLSYFSPNGEEGYPGNLQTEAIYHLDEEDAFSIQYIATTDQDTIVNLTNHSYFNLNGHDFASLEAHEVQIFADKFTEVDENILPTGHIRFVEYTPMDFREPQLLLSRIEEKYDQLVLGNGYDHNWMVNGTGLRPFIRAKGLRSGITMEVYSDQPGVQMYTANFLQLQIKGKDNITYPTRCAVCFETQGFPDAPNKREFPLSILKSREKYEQKTIFRLKAE